MIIKKMFEVVNSELEKHPEHWIIIFPIAVILGCGIFLGVNSLFVRLFGQIGEKYFIIIVLFIIILYIIYLLYCGFMCIYKKAKTELENEK